ncbi:alpha/beta fold hydrolase [Calidifontibacter terrae]
MENYTRNGLVFDVTDSGPADADTIVLLHGFPQDRTAWHEVAQRLNTAGYRTLAPDQRGYSPAASPSQVSAYAMRELVGDVAALIEASGREKVHVVGHDWGGAVAWAVAAFLPDKVASLTVLSTPHPTAMQWAMRHGGQWKNSWYMGAFQIPFLPERVLAGRLQERLFTPSGLPTEQASHYVERFSTPQSLHGPLNWYRALAKGMLRGSKSAGDRAAGPMHRPLEIPTTYVWGRKDVALGRAAAEKTEEFVGGSYHFIELDAGHWLPERRPVEVVEAVLDRVTSVTGS